MRERRPPQGVPVSSTPLLLVHGATIASALWDAPLPGWSFMDRLARQGLHVFAVDLRGYGGSSRPACFSEPPDSSPAYARAADVVADVSDALDAVREWTGAAQVDLLGGSWGSVICGMVAAEHAVGRVRRLVLYAPLYAEPNYRPTWLPPVRGPFQEKMIEETVGAYRWVTIDALRARWDEEIPFADKSLWRPQGMLATMIAPYIENPGGGADGPAGLKVPNGTLVDLYRVFDGRPLYDCAQVTMPTLLIRGQADPISTRDDALRLLDGLGTSDKHYVDVANGAHFMVAERTSPRVQEIVTGFLQD
ncbi:alpha/beta hydrolase [Rhodospirillaceae bacterium KN72]|uniref:Alpha/beta hydrolase n=1 Tax=Pacificispira spongiicola TaxID=2729598 RepID=A0A7Y0HG52_9PROT|nr:alpha/beta fold hydrolase [Pacificispira spongiicola]NMM45293.1 alpha/beta hydrolase [Pacificispira spongiicola]